MISPFYEEPGITIYCGRAEEVLPSLADRSFGTLLLDPPYTPPTDKLMQMMQWMKPESRVLVLGVKCYTVLPGKLGWIGCEELAVTPAFGHPTVRSVAIMKDLLAECPPNPILDPYMGTGTTLVAAKMLGREGVGIECDEGYCVKAVERLKQA